MSDYGRILKLNFNASFFSFFFNAAPPVSFVCVWALITEFKAFGRELYKGTSDCGCTILQIKPSHCDYFWHVMVVVTFNRWEWSFCINIFIFTERTITVMMGDLLKLAPNEHDLLHLKNQVCVAGHLCSAAAFHINAVCRTFDLFQKIAASAIWLLNRFALGNIAIFNNIFINCAVMPCALFLATHYKGLRRAILASYRTGSDMIFPDSSSQFCPGQGVVFQKDEIEVTQLQELHPPPSHSHYLFSTLSTSFFFVLSHSPHCPLSHIS